MSYELSEQDRESLRYQLTRYGSSGGDVELLDFCLEFVETLASKAYSKGWAEGEENRIDPWKFYGV